MTGTLNREPSEGERLQWSFLNPPTHPPQAMGSSGGTFCTGTLIRASAPLRITRQLAQQGNTGKQAGQEELQTPHSGIWVKAGQN